MAKPLKRGNGQGSCYKLSGRRSRPWVSKKTIGWDENGKQLYVTIGYYATKDEAMMALLNYNANPYDITGGKATFTDVYEKWSEKKYPTISDSNVTGYKMSYKYCEYLHDKPFKDITLDDLEYTLEQSGKNYPTLKKMKILLNEMYKYAVPRKLCQTDYAHYVDINKYKDKNPNKFDRTAFTDDEIAIMRKYALEGNKVSKIACMLVYGGYRIGEFLNIRKEDCHMDEGYVHIVKSKTESGIRLVPIADFVRPFYEEFMENPSEYLIYIDRTFEGTSKEKGYRAFMDCQWKPTMKAIGFEGRHIHETRHTTETLLQRVKTPQVFTDRIMGHASNGIGQSVYTHLAISDLMPYINAISNMGNG